MTKRKGINQHYERFFENILRENEVLYLAIDEKRKPIYDGKGVKNFDFLVSSFNGKYLIDVKGKKFPYLSSNNRKNYWENWIKTDDISGLKLWSSHFNSFTPLLVYPYHIHDESFIHEIDEYSDIYQDGDNYYGVVGIELSTYYVNAKSRSKGWEAISVSREKFKDLVKPISHFIPELKKNW